ncbi:type IV pilus assembly protein PilM [Candidatus Kaiserbacteria bacterium]|nr:type IV pilus assembly protein PilM [Candidatus Kaiserbacteria bacterium]
MLLSRVSSKIGEDAAALSRTLSRWFPMPTLLMPPAAGIDISDASVKWLTLERAGTSMRIGTYGEVPIPEGVVVSGIIKDTKALSETLREVRKHLGHVHAAHAALPEEGAYVFSMVVPHATPREQILRMVEFEFEGRIPIPPSAAVYDYSPIFARSGAEPEEVSVIVFPKDIAEAYVEAFNGAGITLLSLEVEARSIARAVSTGAPDEPVTLVVDFGRARTGFSVLKRGVPIFTSTVEVGGDAITRTLTEKMHMSPEEAAHFKNEQGLNASKENAPAMEAILGTASALADEVTRHYHYWDTRRNDKGERMTPVGKVVLVGGNANLAGLTDYIAGRVQASVERGDPWRHVIDFDEYIPPIERKIALQYATAIGLALRSL